MGSGHETLSIDETICMSMERHVVKTNPDALTLLAVLALLPAGTTGGNLRRWVPGLHSSSAAVQSLRLAALIEQEDGPFGTARIFLRPTIQTHISQQNCISADVRKLVHNAGYRFVLDHKSVPDDRQFQDDLTALAGEETNIQGLLLDVDVNDLGPNAFDALIAFALYQSWTKPSSTLASHASRIAQAAHDNPGVVDPYAAARRVAEAHRCLERNLFALSLYAKAYKHFEEASCIYKNIPGGMDPIISGECSMETVHLWRFMKGEGNDELETRVYDAEANLSHDGNERFYVACGLLGPGAFLCWRERREEALEKLSSARAIFKELDCPASTAQALYYMSRTYARLDEPQEALLLAQDALAKAEECGEIGLICRTSRMTALCLLGSEAYDDALGSHDLSVPHRRWVSTSAWLKVWNCWHTLALRDWTFRVLELLTRGQ
ncbi:hypothetical protein R3P38DRAFT_603318 [Favolaschia claudopus]|uniref:Uncharacterized protein n=1 Tax=Favolaschia claudopus TaxID=2862362 RepID=A0AAW0CAD9_9AGAR